MNFSVSLACLGKPLKVWYDNNIITNIELIIDENKINFLDVINHNRKLSRKAIFVFDHSYDFYFVKDKSSFVYAVKIIESNVLEKIKFSINGVVISKVQDSVQGDFVIRKIGNKIITLKDNNIVKIKHNIYIKPINKYLSSK